MKAIYVPLLDSFYFSSTKKRTKGKVPNSDICSFSCWSKDMTFFSHLIKNLGPGYSSLQLLFPHCLIFCFIAWIKMVAAKKRSKTPIQILSLRGKIVKKKKVINLYPLNSWVTAQSLEKKQQQIHHKGIIRRKEGWKELCIVRRALRIKGLGYESYKPQPSWVVLHKSLPLSEPQLTHGKWTGEGWWSLWFFPALKFYVLL